jgi:hypothetical protein
MRFLARLFLNALAILIAARMVSCSVWSTSPCVRSSCC